MSKNNYIFATLLTGTYDVNRNEVLEKDSFKIIQQWYDSIAALQLNAIVFHNTFSSDTVAKYENDFIKFVAVEYDKIFNPNVYRYFIYQDYIRANSEKIDNLFITDIADVEVLQNPFIDELFIQNNDFLFCGDEPEILDNEWMRNHCTHLRNLMPDFKNYEALNKTKILLNCGIIGGAIEVMKSLISAITLLHKTYTISNNTPFTLDMGVFNYAARTVFDTKIKHGKPVNTVFKKYETQRTDCWFRHK